MSLSDDPRAKEMRENVRKSTVMMGFPKDVDCGVLFANMQKTLEKSEHKSLTLGVGPPYNRLEQKQNPTTKTKSNVIYIPKKQSSWFPAAKLVKEVEKTNKGGGALMIVSGNQSDKAGNGYAVIRFSALKAKTFRGQRCTPMPSGSLVGTRIP